MCLQIIGTNNSISRSLPEPLVAEQDIKVFKILWDNLASPYMDYPYNANTRYHIEDMHPTFLYTNYRDYSQYIVTVGLHAYQSLKEAESCAIIFADEYRNVIIVKMTIPKGAHYYIGTVGDIVSDTLISGDLNPINSERINWINHMQTADIAG